MSTKLPDSTWRNSNQAVGQCWWHEFCCWISSKIKLKHEFQTFPTIGCTWCITSYFSRPSGKIRMHLVGCGSLSLSRFRKPSVPWGYPCLVQLPNLPDQIPSGTSASCRFTPPLNLVVSLTSSLYVWSLGACGQTGVSRCPMGRECMCEVGAREGWMGALPLQQQMLPINFLATGSQRDWGELGVARDSGEQEQHLLRLTAVIRSWKDRQLSIPLFSSLFLSQSTICNNRASAKKHLNYTLEDNSLASLPLTLTS